jgi:hypothetical protein
MKFGSTVSMLVSLSVLMSIGLPGRAQETVTIPKSRLEELERKEAELDKLKGDLKQTSTEKVQKPSEQNAARLAKVPAEITHVSPPVRSLPAFSDAETVNAIDLANYYAEDVGSANQRYHKRTFKLKGEITEFEIPPFLSRYQIVLKTADRDRTVVCDFARPEQYSAVVKTEHGSRLVGLMSGKTRVPIARVGDVVVIQGRCEGLKDSTVTFARCQLIH